MTIRTRTVTRGKLSYYERGPGPAGYGLPPLVGRRGHAVTHLINPEYTIRPKFPYILKNVGPGAGGYLIPYGLKARGWDKSPAFSMRTKTDLERKNQGPGPAGYNLPCTDTYRWKPPAFTIKSRNPLLRRFQTPAPNVYIIPPAIGPKIPDKLAAPECTLKGHRDNKEKPYVPTGSYDVGECDLIKPKAPAFTIRRKLEEIKARGFPRVGPGSYDADLSKVKAAAPAWHMAEKYNEFTGIFRTTCDKSSYEPLDC